MIMIVIGGENCLDCMGNLVGILTEGRIKNGWRIIQIQNEMIIGPSPSQFYIFKHRNEIIQVYAYVRILVYW